MSKVLVLLLLSASVCVATADLCAICKTMSIKYIEMASLASGIGDKIKVKDLCLSMNPDEAQSCELIKSMATDICLKVGACNGQETGKIEKEKKLVQSSSDGPDFNLRTSCFLLSLIKPGIQNMPVDILRRFTRQTCDTVFHEDKEKAECQVRALKIFQLVQSEAFEEHCGKKPAQ